MLGVADNSDTEGFYNIIANIFQVVLVEAPVITPHALPQLEPKLLLEVDKFIKSQVSIPVISNTVFLFPSPQIVLGYPFQCAKVPIISRELFF